jgi:hypothetical protein
VCASREFFTNHNISRNKIVKNKISRLPALSLAAVAMLATANFKLSTSINRP